MSRTRVLRVIARLNIGGPAIHATLLTERLDPSRYESTLVAGTEDATEGDYLALHGLEIASLSRIPELGRELQPRDVSALAKLVRLIRRVRPHVVHTHTAKAGALGRLAAFLCRVPIVVHTFHGHVLRGYFSPFKTNVFRGIERSLARASDCLVTVTPEVRADLLDLGVGTPGQYEVVPLGFDLDRFRTAAARRGELRAEIGVGPTAPLVGIVARLVPIKAHDVFLAAAARVARTHPDARFLVVGDGESKPALVARAAQLGVGDRTLFLGWRGDLPALYADLDVVVLTSRNEGSPVALIEALASARPVVSTRVGGVPDVVTDGETGRLVPMDDDEAVAAGVEEVLADPGAAARRAVEGRTRVFAKYGADRLVSDIDRIYTRLLAAKGIRP